MSDPTPPAAPNPARILCPYCGAISSNPKRCEECAGFFDPLSRQATQNAMGPWFIRDAKKPFHPGCSYETLKDLIRKARFTRETILRGPTTHQLWNFAARTPSVANLLGICHNCRREVKPDDFACAGCGAAFTPETDRQHLGLSPVHLLPGQAAPEVIAAASMAASPPPKARQSHNGRWIALLLIAAVVGFTASLSREALLGAKREAARIGPKPAALSAAPDLAAPTQVTAAAPIPTQTIQPNPPSASIPPTPLDESTKPAKPAPESLAETIARELREGRLTDADLAQRITSARASMTAVESAEWDRLLAQREAIRRLSRLP
ncbi:MAG: hypothetical protein ACKVW3_09725 [Phycisphaerales bacterium]